MIDRHAPGQDRSFPVSLEADLVTRLMSFASTLSHDAVDCQAPVPGGHDPLVIRDIHVDAHVRVRPFDFRDDACALDRLVCVIFHRERVVRENRQRGKQRERGDEDAV